MSLEPWLRTQARCFTSPKCWASVRPIWTRSGCIASCFNTRSLLRDYCSWEKRLAAVFGDVHMICLVLKVGALVQVWRFTLKTKFFKAANKNQVLL